MDKLIVNVENSIVSAGSSALEVLQRSPGVIVDQNDNISLRGRQGVIIMIDGKPTQLGSQELANMLRGMASSTIEKIEIITNPSAKYDAAGNAGIINIRMKKDQRVGTNGNFSASVGYNDYWRANTALSLNYRNRKWNLFGNYSYANTVGYNNLILTRKFREEGEVAAIFKQDNYVKFPFSNHVARVGVDFSPSKNTTIGIVANGISNAFNPTGDSETIMLDANEQRTGSFTTQNRSQDQWNNYSLNTNIRQVFDSLGRELTADFDYARYSNETDQNFLTENFTPERVLMNQSIFIGDINGYLNIYSAKMDYTHPINEKMKIEAGVKTSFVKTDNDLQYFDRINGEDIYNPGWSNQFIYKENINAGYLNYRHEFSKTWSMQLGLRGEQTIADGLQVTTDSSFNRNYFQFFPSVFVQWSPSEKHSFNYSMSRRIDRPSYRQLNPFRGFVDRTTYSEGNPFLLPQLTYSFEVSHTFLQRFTTTFNYSITDDVITQVFLQDDEQRIMVQSIANIAELEYYGLSFSATFNPVKWWNNRTELNGFHSRYTGVVANTQLDNALPTFYINSINRLTLPKGFSGEVTFFYHNKSAYGITTIQPMWQLSLGLQKNILQNKGTLRLNVNDIFWKGYPRGVTKFANVDEVWKARRPTRMAMLTFTYRFGKTTVAPSRRRVGGAEEEKQRAGNNG
ncbi:MAG: TonB-dependent receptor [Saprospiraceae bacterium]|nr:TonB-dependent receptor [Saprospiraceae bacterium]